jgi:hypothetical protein
MTEAIAEARNTAAEMNKPKAGNPQMNPSKMVKRTATAMILLNPKDFFLGVRKPIVDFLRLCQAAL